jgi:hypothetical protein
MPSGKLKLHGKCWIMYGDLLRIVFRAECKCTVVIFLLVMHAFSEEPRKIFNIACFIYLLEKFGEILRVSSISSCTGIIFFH